MSPNYPLHIIEEMSRVDKDIDYVQSASLGMPVNTEGTLRMDVCAVGVARGYPKPLCILFCDTKGIQWVDTVASITMWALSLDFESNTN